MLDLLSQLLSTENIVKASIDGFHRSGLNYGGKVLQSLKNNVSDRNKGLAESIISLINEHKERWINETISARCYVPR